MNITTEIAPNGIGNLGFSPLRAPNAIFLTIFIILFICQIFLCFRFWRFYGYAIGMLGGLLLELLGYVAKVQLSSDRGDKNAYIMYIIGLTLGPTFLSSSLYLGVGALQRHFQATCFSPVGPRLFATIFILGDFICLSFIGVGGSLAAIYSDQPIGVNLMIVGLATQVFFTAIFCVLLCVLYYHTKFRVALSSKRWYMLGASVAAACLFLRSCWRVAELSDGFNGALASNEGLFIALDSIPITLMSLILTYLHPRFWFSGRGKKGLDLS
ncbi:unnamed protein product [Clonostachys rosea]|uniref:Uncharacterized protein n=1 Tax=Bionectria ochroleuca TaxID=29856 RepID=A0ABY6UC85_BIOOC|nr:unnamed protein product [Clonostachys rosea]